MGVNARSSGAAEKRGEGMALKIFTGAKPFLKASIKPFGITDIEMPTLERLFLTSPFSCDISGDNQSECNHLRRIKPWETSTTKLEERPRYGRLSLSFLSCF
jgi:hypothetical protein